MILNKNHLPGLLSAPFTLPIATNIYQPTTHSMLEMYTSTYICQISITFRRYLHYNLLQITTYEFAIGHVYSRILSYSFLCSYYSLRKR